MASQFQMTVVLIPRTLSVPICIHEQSEQLIEYICVSIHEPRINTLYITEYDLYDNDSLRPMQIKELPGKTGESKLEYT